MTSNLSLEEIIIVNDANQGNILKQDKPNISYLVIYIKQFNMS